MKLESIMSVTDYFSASLCHFSAANIVKVEDNAKQKTKFFVFIVEAPPIFATKWQIGDNINTEAQRYRVFIILCVSVPLCCIYMIGAAYLRPQVKDSRRS